MLTITPQRIDCYEVYFNIVVMKFCAIKLKLAHRRLLFQVQKTHVLAMNVSPQSQGHRIIPSRFPAPQKSNLSTSAVSTKKT